MEKSYAKVFKNSLIPLGMIFGCAIGVVGGIYFKPNSLPYTIGIGSGIGYFIGVIAYGIYSKVEQARYE